MFFSIRQKAHISDMDDRATNAPNPPTNKLPLAMINSSRLLASTEQKTTIQEERRLGGIPCALIQQNVTRLRSRSIPTFSPSQSVFWSRLSQLYNLLCCLSLMPYFVARLWNETPEDKRAMFSFTVHSVEKRYLTLSVSQVTVAEDPYSWTIEQAQNQAFFLYVKPINLHVIPHRYLEIQNPWHQVNALPLP